MNRLFTTTAVAGALIAMASPATAQVIKGKVTDVSGSAGLEGAIVTITELNRSVSTNRFGEYRFANIPTGDYKVSVSYVGAKNVTSDVTVPEAGATLNFTVGGDVRYLDNVLVVGSTAAQIGAINQQRSANSIISVIDSDGLGNFPDTTVADSLSRVPGLSVQTDQGEGRYISIRGINSDLIGASINGVRTPSPEDRRGVLLDGVPSDLLDGIEVQKSLTPDLDADSLGGFVNMKTISAFDRDGRFIRAKLETRYNDITQEFSPKGTLTYSEAFADKFGVALSVNYQDLRIEAHNNETGEAAFDDATGFGYMNDDYEQRWYGLNRKRLGFVANFDWRMSESTDLYLRTLLNNYEDDEVRNKLEFRDLDDVEKKGTISQFGISLPLNEVDAEVRVRKETRQIQTVALGGKSVFNAWTFDYEVSYAYAEEDDSDNHDVTFRFKDIQDNFPGLVGFNTKNPAKPNLVGDASVISAIYNPSNYDLDEFERGYTVNEDTEYSAKFDVAYDSILGNTPVTWKGGLKLRDREKIRDEDILFFEPDLNLADYATNSFQGDWRMNNPMPTWPSPGLTTSLRSLYNKSTTSDPDFNVEGSFFDSNIADYNINEKVLAGYGMGTFEFDKLTLIAGVRVEKTDVDMEGRIVTEDELTAAVRKVSNDYTNVLPSINAKYEFTDRLIGRAAYYGAVVRPSFGDMAPFVELNDDQDEAVVGNTNLDPYTADNFDLGLEFYPTDLSVISFGIFYKNIKDAIFENTFDIADVPGSVDLSGIPTAIIGGVEEVTTFINVDESEILGVEFNYVQDLGDLSEMLDGFLFSGNLTLSDSESTLPNGRTVPFLRQSDTIWNIALGYDKGPWDLRISANYRGEYLDELLDTDPDERVLDRYTDNRMLVEASAKYKWNDHLTLYVEGKNLTDEPEYYYFGSERNLSQYDEFGRTFVFGLRATY